MGFRFLLCALADADRSDAIFKMLERDQLGSYRFLVNAGWSTLPESWNANRSYSMNHCMLGHIQEWFVHDLAGIQPDGESLAFKAFHISPVTDGPVSAAAATFGSLYGMIASEWRAEEGLLRMNVTAPVNTVAYVHIPASSAADVTEDGVEIGKAEGVRSVRQEGRTLRCEVGSGHYRFRSAVAEAKAGSSN